MNLKTDLYPNTDQKKDYLNYIHFYSYSTNTKFSFLAFLTDYSDTRTCNWSSQEIYGHMDPVYTYKNTIRKISIGLEIPSFDLEEAKINFTTIETAKKSMYPVYTKKEDVNLLTTPPLYTVRFANLIKTYGYSTSLYHNNGLIGWIDNFAYKPDIQSGFFVDKDSGAYAKLLKLNFTFNVMHDYPLGYDTNNSDRKYITSSTERRTTTAANTPLEELSSDGVLA